jgi:plastocyanin
VKTRRYAVASVIAVAGFAALFAVLPSKGAGREVKLVGFRYRPAAVTIQKGGAVTFTNDSKVTHTATCQSGSKVGTGRCRLDTGDIQPGMFKTLTFPSVGSYTIFCRYHAQAGMVATVSVRP